MNNYKIAIAEDKSMFRAGLSNLINSKDGLEVIIQAENAKDLLIQCMSKVPDLVFMDYQMPGMNGIEATVKLLKKHPLVKVIMLTIFDAEEFVVKSINSGAVGYITKEEDPEEIFKAIDSARTTGYYLNDHTSAPLISKLIKQGKLIPQFNDVVASLSEHEVLVIKMMSKQLTSQEIAEIMFKSVRTIDGYKSSIMEKIGAKNACGIIMFGVKHGLIDVDR